MGAFATPGNALLVSPDGRGATRGEPLIDEKRATTVSSVSVDHPLMISVPVSPYCEMARWTLDRLGISYVEECHAPVFNVFAARKYGGGSVVPIVDTGEKVLHDARAVVDYYDQRAPLDRKLYPADATAQAETKKLFDDIFDNFGVAVRGWAYAYMLPVRSVTMEAWIDPVPGWERIGVQIFYPLLAAALRSNLKLGPDSIAQDQAIIEAALTRVEAQLADGRRFLMGDTFTAPDLALAALSAPITLPPQYGGPLPRLEQLPLAMRAVMESWRSRKSVQFILRLYEENRPRRR